MGFRILCGDRLRMDSVNVYLYMNFSIFEQDQKNQQKTQQTLFCLSKVSLYINSRNIYVKIKPLSVARAYVCKTSIFRRNAFHLWSMNFFVQSKHSRLLPIFVFSSHFYICDSYFNKIRIYKRYFSLDSLSDNCFHS